MKRRSILGFVMGLLGGIGTGIIAFFAFIILAIIFGSVEALGGDTSNSNLLKLLILIYGLSAIIAITASCFYFNKARGSGIIMLFATIMNGAFPIYVILNTTEFAFLMFILLLPTLFMLIATFAGIFSKARPVVAKVVDNAKPSQPQVNEIKYCPQCGSSMKINDLYCPFCGTKQN